MYIKLWYIRTHTKRNMKSQTWDSQWLIIMILILDVHRDYNEIVVTYICTACRHSALRCIELILQQVTESHVLNIGRTKQKIIHLTSVKLTSVFLEVCKVFSPSLRRFLQIYESLIWPCAINLHHGDLGPST
jgi:hypothetical protein